MCIETLPYTHIHMHIHIEINFNGVDLTLGYRKVVFEWEGFYKRDLCHSARIRGQILPTQIPTSGIRIQDPPR